MKNIWNLTASKLKKYNKNADTVLFLLLFTTDQREKKYCKNIICECRRSKKVKNGFSEYFTAISTKSEKQISSKI